VTLKAIREKTGNIKIISTEIEVVLQNPGRLSTIDKNDISNDWAILKVYNSRKSFPVEDIVTICTEIPEMKVEPFFKIYHCPAFNFNQGQFNSLEASPTEWLKPLAMSAETGTITFRCGFFKGSSGGVVVTKSGQAIAMHCESDSSFMDVADPTSLDSVSQAVSSGAVSHSSLSTSLILVTLPDLMNSISK
jgi:hypothetical protein